MSVNRWIFATLLLATGQQVSNQQQQQTESPEFEQVGESLNSVNLLHPDGLLGMGLTGGTSFNTNLMNPFGLVGPPFYPAFLSASSFVTFANSLMNTNSILLPFAINQPYCNQLVVNDMEYISCRAYAAEYWANGGSWYGNYRQNRYSPTSSSSGGASGRSFNSMAQEDTKNACCFFWDVMHCTYLAVYRLCDNTALNFYYDKERELHTNLESTTGICYYYSHNSFTCRYTFWVLIIVFSIIGFLLLLLVAILVVLAIRRRQHRQHEGGSDSESDLSVQATNSSNTRTKTYGGQRANESAIRNGHHHHHGHQHHNPEVRSKSTAIDYDDNDDDDNIDRYQYLHRTTSIRQISI